MTAQFQSSMTEWIGLPFSKLENLKRGNKLVRYLEFHLRHVLRWQGDTHVKVL